MRQPFFAALAILMLGTGSAPAAQPGSPQTQIQVPDGEWRWPLDDYGRDAIGHDYAEYNSCLKTCKHHTHLHNTGIDVPAPKGTPVKAVADGFVVNLIPNDAGCAADCTDHGEGNTLIIEHTASRFSTYQHMLNFNDRDPLIAQIKQHCTFYDRSDENGVHVSGWECTKADGITISQGDVVGRVGGTGFGRNKT